LQLVMSGSARRSMRGDLEGANHQSAAGPPAGLVVGTTAFGAWARRLAEHVTSVGLDGDLGYWSEVPGRASAALPVDHDGPNTLESTRTLTLRLGRDETDALLHQVPEVYRTQVNDVLVSALG